jgi:hypothetical protein
MSDRPGRRSRPSVAYREDDPRRRNNDNNNHNHNNYMYMEKKQTNKQTNKKNEVKRLNAVNSSVFLESLWAFY